MIKTWKMIQLCITVCGGFLGAFLGGVDGLMYTLIAFIIIDYITGFMCAVIEHRLSSEVGFRGIFRKIVILMLVGIANLIDVNVIGSGAVLRTAVIFFYLSNEGVSILENAGNLGLPIPAKLHTVLSQLQDKAEAAPIEPTQDQMDEAEAFNAPVGGGEDDE